MTVTEIVQKLLEKGHISAEEAIILLKAEIGSTKQNVQYPTYPDYPYNPPTINPILPYQPQIWYGTAGQTGPIGNLNDNFTQK